MCQKRELKKRVEQIEQIERVLSSSKGGGFVFSQISKPANCLKSWLLNENNFRKSSLLFKEQVESLKLEITELIVEDSVVKGRALLEGLNKLKSNISNEIKKIENAPKGRSGSKSSNGGRRVQHHRKSA